MSFDSARGDKASRLRWRKLCSICENQRSLREILRLKGMSQKIFREFVAKNC